MTAHEQENCSLLHSVSGERVGVCGLETNPIVVIHSLKWRMRSAGRR